MKKGSFFAGLMMGILVTGAAVVVLLKRDNDMLREECGCDFDDEDYDGDDLYDLEDNDNPFGEREDDITLCEKDDVSEEDASPVADPVRGDVDWDALYAGLESEDGYF